MTAPCEIEAGASFPSEGEVLVMSSGKPIAGVVHHPRIPNQWLAMWPPSVERRDSGMKRYRTRAGAVRRVETEMKREVT